MKDLGVEICLLPFLVVGKFGVERIRGQMRLVVTFPSETSEFAD